METATRRLGDMVSGMYLDSYLEGQGDLVSGLIRRISRVTIWVIGIINLLNKSP